jgi:hypothetical protein
VLTGTDASSGCFTAGVMSVLGALAPGAAAAPELL